jgi:hypothetical protein
VARRRNRDEASPAGGRVLGGGPEDDEARGGRTPSCG